MPHITCPECKNEYGAGKDQYEQGDWFECPYCGVTVEVSGVDENGEPRLEVVEEEK